MIVVEPIALTDDTAVLRHRDYDALIQAYEDAADALALAEVRGREAAGDAEYVPAELAERIFVGGERPVRVWREHRGLTLGALAKEAGMAQSWCPKSSTAGNAARSGLWLRSPRCYGSTSRISWRQRLEQRLCRCRRHRRAGRPGGD